ncbi:MAG: hypothetical protein WBE08_12655 [Methyloceanibacter sp.]|jgi:hypothetical protein
MRSTILLAAALAVAMLLPRGAFAFETSDAPPTLTLEDGATRFSDPSQTTVLPEISLEAYGGSMGSFRPNYIPEPPTETPNWLYSSPAFRSAR